MRILFLIAAATIVVSGCGGGGGGDGPVSAPLAEPVVVQATDIWEGTLYSTFEGEQEVACVVTPGLQLRCMNEDKQVLFGAAVVARDGRLSSNYTWADPMGLTPGEVSDGKGIMVCDYSPHDSAECDLESDGKSGAFASGKMILFHKDFDPQIHSCFIRQFLTQAEVADAWAPWTQGSAMLSIDVLGRAFAQDAETGCFMSGQVNVYSDNPGEPYNLLQVTLLIEGCTDAAYAEYNGRTLRGYAFLDNGQQQKDTLVVVAAVRGPNGYAAFARRYHRQ